MRLADVFAADEFGNRPDGLKDARVGARGESKAVCDHLQQLLPLLVNLAKVSEQ